MKGRFINVKKDFYNYCFIYGEDKKEYFMHKKGLKNRKDWNIFVYNTNTCEFDTQIDEGKERPRAINVIPNKDDTEKQLIDEEERRERHRLAAERHARQIAWTEFIKKHVYYVINIKRGGKWQFYEPITLYKDFTECRKKQETINSLLDIENITQIIKVFKLNMCGNIALVEFKFNRKDNYAGKTLLQDKAEKFIIKECITQKG